MPSHDATGKRLSGGAQRARAAERAAARAAGQPAAEAAPAAPAAPASRHRKQAARLRVERPPRGKGLDALIAWTARAQVAAAGLAAAGLDPPRVRAVLHCTRAIGAVKVAARDSEVACRALQVHAGERVVYDLAKPPKEDVGLMAWVAWALADLLYHAATAPVVDDTEIGHRASALRGVEKVAPQAALDQVVERFRDKDA